MNARFVLSSALLLACALPGAALANPSMAGGMGRGAEASFTRMDADGDGKATREEFSAAFPQMKEGAFTAIDKNGDGAISREEWLEFMRGHAADEAAAHPEGMGMPAGHPPTGGMNGTAPASPPAPAGAPDLVMPSK